MFNIRNLVWFIPVLALLTLPLWYPAVTAFLAPPLISATEVSTGEILQSMDMEDVVLSQFVGEEQRWRITARKLHSKDGDSDLRLQEIEALFLGEQGTDSGIRSSATIQAAKAWYEKDSKQLLLRDDVVVTTESGYEIQAAMLQFFEDKRELLADKGVRITGSTFTLQGERMSYHIDTRYLQVIGHVVATLN